MGEKGLVMAVRGFAMGVGPLPRKTFLPPKGGWSAAVIARVRAAEKAETPLTEGWRASNHCIAWQCQAPSGPERFWARCCQTLKDLTGLTLPSLRSRILHPVRRWWFLMEGPCPTSAFRIECSLLRSPHRVGAGIDMSCGCACRIVRRNVVSSHGARTLPRRRPREPYGRSARCSRSWQRNAPDPREVEVLSIEDNGVHAFRGAARAPLCRFGWWRTSRSRR